MGTETAFERSMDPPIWATVLTASGVVPPGLVNVYLRGRGLLKSCAVWFGAVWCGVVWCGVVWCGVVRVSNIYEATWVHPWQDWTC